MLFNREYIIILAILGIALLYQYYYLATTEKNVLKLWGRIKGILLNVYYVSMILSALGFLVFFYYLFISSSFSSSEITKMFIALVLIIVISMFWMPLSFRYLKKKSELLKYLIILVLFLVSVSTLYLIYVLNSVKEQKYIGYKNAALVGMIYFFIHVFFFDCTTWSYNYF
jgi:hypothetical protein